MGKEEIEFLKERGREFWERGFEDFEKRRYNLAVLDFEQAIQLWLKYLIALKTGDFPKTHYITELIEDVIEIYELTSLESFIENNRLSIKGIEDAYITSRYFPRKFTKEEVSEVIKIASEIKNVLEDAAKSKFV